MKKELACLSLSLVLAWTSVEVAVAQARSQAVRRGTPGQTTRRSARARPRTVDPRLEKILVEWEAHSSKIQTLRAEFAHLYYDEIFGKRDPKTGRVLPQKGRGELIYRAPDQGIFRVYDEGARRGLFDFIEKDRERWVCTGTEVYQYNNRLKPPQVTITPLPKELQGSAITEGPLPFIFGMKAEQAKRRYRMRLRERKDLRPEDVLIEVHPLRKQDLVNFSRAFVILDTKNYLPRAIQVDDPRAEPAQGSDDVQRASRTVYLFHGRSGRSTVAVNVRLRGTEFRTPTRGYRVIRNDALVADEADPPATRQSGAPRETRKR